MHLSNQFNLHLKILAIISIHLSGNYDCRVVYYIAEFESRINNVSQRPALSYHHNPNSTSELIHIEIRTAIDANRSSLTLVIYLLYSHQNNAVVARAVLELSGWLELLTVCIVIELR